MEKLKESLKKDIIKKMKEYHGKDAEIMFNFFYNLSRPKIESYSKDILWKIRYLHFPHTRGRKLGNKTKAMPDSIYQQVIKHFSKVDPELKLTYEVEGIEGPRIGDVLELKEDNVDFKEHILHVENHKVKHWYDVPLQQGIEKDLKNWITKHKDEINKHDGFIFFTRDEAHHPNRKYQHLTQQFVNRKLVAFLESKGLNQVYAIREGDGGKLHLLTTHSHRGHAATAIKNLTGKKEDAMQLLDHSPRSSETTELYFERPQSDLFKAMRES